MWPFWVIAGLLFLAKNKATVTPVPSVQFNAPEVYVSGGGYGGAGASKSAGNTGGNLNPESVIYGAITQLAPDNPDVVSRYPATRPGASFPAVVSDKYSNIAPAASMALPDAPLPCDDPGSNPNYCLLPDGSLNTGRIL